MTRKRSIPLLTAACIFLGSFLCGGCGKTVIPPSGQPVSVSVPDTSPLFVPLDVHTARILPEHEALRLVSALSPRQQGLGSWKDMDAAVRRSLAFARNRPAEATALSFPGLAVTWGEIARGTGILHSLLPALDRSPELLAHAFRWIRIGPDFSFTGYYEPTLKASHKPTAELPHPLYRRPPDLRSGQPYYTRNQIDRQGVLRGRKLEIAYVTETDAYFLQVQGSGKLRFADGSATHVLYAGKNNRPYASLGRIMRERGLLPEGGVNMRAIRDYLAQYPEQRAELFDANASYVFFRPETYGPIGSMGAVLTPWVSLAVDRNVIPQGSVTMIVAPLPDAEGQHTRPFPALALPQDSGGAIKGHRMDLFCGEGLEAEHIAGHLDVKGAVYILLPR